MREWLDIWLDEPIRNTEILFMTGDESIHIGVIYSEEKLRKCNFYSFLDKKEYACDLATKIEDRVFYWMPLPPPPKS